MELIYSTIPLFSVYVGHWANEQVNRADLSKSLCVCVCFEHKFWVRIDRFAEPQISFALVRRERANSMDSNKMENGSLCLHHLATNFDCGNSESERESHWSAELNEENRCAYYSALWCDVFLLVLGPKLVALMNMNCILIQHLLRQHTHTQT